MKNLIPFHTNTANTIKHMPSSGIKLPVIISIIVFSLILILSGCSTHKPPTKSAHREESPASQIIHFYRGPLNHLSSVRHGGCPMHPGCSSYGLSAIEKHGPLIGWMMIFDRLMRCGLDETHLSPEVIVNGNWKYIDTLEQNDFWWHSAPENTSLVNTQPSEYPLHWGISVE